MESQHFHQVQSLRDQAGEAYHTVLSDFINERKRSNNEIFQATCFMHKRMKNEMDSIYPKRDDYGEVVAMGTEDSQACGLIVDVDASKLFEYEPTLIPASKLDVNGDKAVVSVAAGGLHSACLHGDGTVSTWGANDDGACGRVIDDDEPHLIGPVKGVKDIVQIGAGDNHTLFLDVHGIVYACGMYKDIDSGKFRERKTPNDTDIKGHHKSPVKVLGLPDKIRQIDAGPSFNAALSSDSSTLYTWGMGNNGELARSKSMGAELCQKEFKTVDGEDGVYQAYNLDKTWVGGEKEVWDEDDKKHRTAYVYNRELIRDKFLTPSPVEWAGGLNPKRRVLSFSCGDIHLLVVAWDLGSCDTQVYSAGNSGFGQLGHGDLKEVHELKPIKALADKRIGMVAAGNLHSLALSMNGRALYSWGKIFDGALGLFDEEQMQRYQATDYNWLPEEVAFPTDLGKSCLVDIAAGNTSSFAITDKGNVYSWGYNENSQAGHYNVPGDPGRPDEYGNNPTNIISRPRLLDVNTSVNDGIPKESKTHIANSCRVIKVSGGGQHSLMVVKRYK